MRHSESIIPQKINKQPVKKNPKINNSMFLMIFCEIDKFCETMKCVPSYRTPWPIDRQRELPEWRVPRVRQRNSTCRWLRDLYQPDVC